MKKTSARLFIFLVVLAAVFLQPFVVFSEEQERQMDLPYLLQNDDALLSQRKAALDEFMNQENIPDEMYQSMLRILQEKGKTEPAKEFRNYLQEKMIDNKNPKMIFLLRSKLADSQTDASIREIALFILWKINFQDVLPAAEKMMKNLSENESLRLAAINHLASVESSQELTETAINLFNNRRESPAIRHAVLRIIQNGSDEKEMQKFFRKVVSDPTETTALRKAFLMKSDLANFPDLEKLYLDICKNPKNDVAVKQIALYALSKNKEKLPSVLPELRRLLRLESNSKVRADLESLINQAAEKE